MNIKQSAILTALLACLASPSLADPITIEAVSAKQSGSSWNFSVTLRHADSGWDHYADGWEVQTPEGEKLGYRELLHPHVSEQPFTRSLGSVEIPAGMTRVIVRAHCSVDGWVGQPFEVILER
ncbi:MAG: hypothetical protein ACU0CA_04420 [Paracoccaceae bacterium]